MIFANTIPDATNSYAGLRWVSGTVVREYVVNRRQGTRFFRTGRLNFANPHSDVCSSWKNGNRLAPGHRSVATRTSEGQFVSACLAGPRQKLLRRLRCPRASQQFSCSAWLRWPHVHSSSKSPHRSSLRRSSKSRYPASSKSETRNGIETFPGSGPSGSISTLRRRLCPQRSKLSPFWVSLHSPQPAHSSSKSPSRYRSSSKSRSTPSSDLLTGRAIAVRIGNPEIKSSHPDGVRAFPLWYGFWVNRGRSC